ncbi:hypothetical protein PM082_018369 [Marasmius tenuissimus]|nr:hypothetical protein PM082_018369 [Marasmius tenuissimus]
MALTEENLSVANIRELFSGCPHHCPHKDITSHSAKNPWEYCHPLGPKLSHSTNHLSGSKHKENHPFCNSNCPAYVNLSRTGKAVPGSDLPVYLVARACITWGAAIPQRGNEHELSWWTRLKNNVTPGPWKIFIDAINEKTPQPPKSVFVDGSLGPEPKNNWYETIWRKQYPGLWHPGCPNPVFDTTAATSNPPRVADREHDSSPPAPDSLHTVPVKIPKEGSLPPPVTTPTYPSRCDDSPSFPVLHPPHSTNILPYPSPGSPQPPTPFLAPSPLSPSILPVAAFRAPSPSLPSSPPPSLSSPLSESPSPSPYSFLSPPLGDNHTLILPQLSPSRDEVPHQTGLHQLLPPLPARATSEPGVSPFTSLDPEPGAADPDLLVPMQQVISLPSPDTEAVHDFRSLPARTTPEPGASPSTSLDPEPGAADPDLLVPMQQVISLPSPDTEAVHDFRSLPARTTPEPGASPSTSLDPEPGAADPDLLVPMQQVISLPSPDTEAVHDFRSLPARTTPEPGASPSTSLDPEPGAADPDLLVPMQQVISLPSPDTKAVHDSQAAPMALRKAGLESPASKPRVLWAISACQGACLGSSPTKWTEVEAIKLRDTWSNWTTIVKAYTNDKRDRLVRTFLENVVDEKNHPARRKLFVGLPAREDRSTDCWQNPIHIILDEWASSPRFFALGYMLIYLNRWNAHFSFLRVVQKLRWYRTLKSFDISKPGAAICGSLCRKELGGRS